MHAYIFLDKLLNNLLSFYHLFESFYIIDLQLYIVRVKQYIAYYNHMTSSDPHA